MIIGGVAFREDSYDLGTVPSGSLCFPKLVQSGPYRKILNNSVDIADRLNRE